MILYGGYSSGGGLAWGGARYRPEDDVWLPMSTEGGPGRRIDHAVVWTGDELLVWGGATVDDPTWEYGLFDPFSYPHQFVGRMLNDGYRYDPAVDTWSPMATAGAPPPQYFMHAVWTGEEMWVFDGRDPTDDGFIVEGGRYDPVADTWEPFSGPFQSGGTALWTGAEVLVWGGRDRRFLLDAPGARYDLQTDRWERIPQRNGPSRDLYSSTVVWSGEEMIVWGGVLSDSETNRGWAYTPP